MTESILEHPDLITTGEPGPVDAEVVLSRFHTRFKRSRRLPSFAGKGWPERMRSTAFLFFGLTAAAGLALVAIFAQLNFPLLSPVPVGGGHSQSGGVAQAVALDREGALALAPARRSPLASTGRGKGSAGGLTAPNEHGGHAVGAVGGPTPIPAPEETGGDVGGVPPAAPPATPAPAPSPAPSGSAESAAAPPAPSPTPSPESSSKDHRKPASSKPAKAKPTKPDKPNKPAKDDAKAEKKEEKAAPKPKDEESKTPGSKYEPAPEPAPKAPAPAPEDSAGKDHGNGKALGHDK
jgi:DNA polymerase-3 subunit gamma/tau